MEMFAREVMPLLRERVPWGRQGWLRVIGMDYHSEKHEIGTPSAVRILAL